MLRMRGESVIWQTSPMAGRVVFQWMEVWELGQDGVGVGFGAVDEGERERVVGGRAAIF